MIRSDVSRSPDSLYHAETIRFYAIVQESYREIEGFARGRFRSIWLRSRTDRADNRGLLNSLYRKQSDLHERPSVDT